MDLKDFQQYLGYHFSNQNLLQEALTHKSAKKSTHNERLEFLGDAVLDLIIGEFLYKKFPHSPEGELSKMRASMVNEKAFAKIARYLNIGEYLYISHSEEQNNGREKDSILSNAFEAIVGAIYLESGLEKVQTIVLKILDILYPKIDLENLFYDYKTSLQELTQALFGITPEYVVLDSKGPDHNKEFLMGVFIQNKEYAQAKGKSKKEAQQNCAKIALKILKDRQ
ncbi:ribonuclease III [Helicobacter canadensis]|uniref:Ribonuclease 3 n=1 Tax=Helicobacter canadensis MIT 98-5491 TaxID=537970 RepID=C5ZXC9_9HELI|nr:ribonuclease III [Helicobacter canadensis]EES89797.1 ribonuclease III [Helicobacter canadensis MIT 98-5491]EFR48592.1 ribonuclease III [Helicobacter canadensis MIT 98-5491]STO99836.1 ribonuclease III [Helicobacter canadensis]